MGGYIENPNLVGTPKIPVTNTPHDALKREKLYRKRPKQRHGPTSSKDDTSSNSDSEKDLTIYKKDYEDYFGSEKATMQTYVVVKSPLHFEASFTPLVPKQTMTTILKHNSLSPKLTVKVPSFFP